MSDPVTLQKPSFDEKTGIINFGVGIDARRFERTLRMLAPSISQHQLLGEITPAAPNALFAPDLEGYLPERGYSAVKINIPLEGLSTKVKADIANFIAEIEKQRQSALDMHGIGLRVFRDGNAVRGARIEKQIFNDENLIVMSSPEVINLLARHANALGITHSTRKVVINHMAGTEGGEERAILRITARTINPSGLDQNNASYLNTRNRGDLNDLIAKMEKDEPKLTALVSALRQKSTSEIESSEAFARITGGGRAYAPTASASR